MFTSLLNTVCAYDPVGLGLPYNHLLFQDTSEPLVDAALQILIVTLDHDTSVPGVRINLFDVLTFFINLVIVSSVVLYVLNYLKVFMSFCILFNRTAQK